MILVLERLGKRYFIKVEDTETTSSTDYYDEIEYTIAKKVWIIGPDTAERIDYRSTNNLEISKRISARLIGKLPNHSYDISYAPDLFNRETYTGIDFRIPEYILMSDDFSDIEKARCIVYANQVHYKVIKYLENTTMELEEIFEKFQKLIWGFGNNVWKKSTISELYEKVFDETFEQRVRDVNECLQKHLSQNLLYTSAHYKDRVPFFFVLNKNEKKATDISDILSDFLPKNTFEVLNYLQSYVFKQQYLIGLNSYKDLRDLIWNEEISYHLARTEEANMSQITKLTDWKNAIYKWNREYDEYSSPGITNDFIENIGLREQMEILPLKEFEDYWTKSLSNTNSINVEFCTNQNQLSETMSQLVLGGVLDTMYTRSISRNDVITYKGTIKKWEFINIINNIWKFDFSKISGYEKSKLFFVCPSNRKSGFIIDDSSGERSIAFALNIFS